MVAALETGVFRRSSWLHPRPEREIAASKEKAFFSTFRDLFVGAKLKGKSGFVNWM
jgi:hypothetical protein